MAAGADRPARGGAGAARAARSRDPRAPPRGARARAQVRRPGARSQGAAGRVLRRRRCATRSRGWAALMDDALGIGLAATQSASCTGCSSTASSPTARSAAREPEIEWSRRGRGAIEEGCLSLPGVGRRRRAPDPRARARQRRARRAARRSRRPGLEARVIQHEIDHLDGVLILDRTSARPAQAGDARAARGDAPARRRRLAAVERACAPSTSAPRSSRPRCSSGSPPARTARRSSSPGPTARGPRPQALAAAGRRRARASSASS